VRTSSECLTCVVTQAARTARLASRDPGLQERIRREALGCTQGLSFAMPPVFAGRRVQRLIRRLTGEHDPYRELKQRSTAMALRLLPELRRRVLRSRMPLGAALSVAMAANALDFGIFANVEEDALRRALIDATADSTGQAVVAFVAEAAAAHDILYIGDNAGEIVFDGLVIDLLGPAKVTLAVRGGPIVNDATLEDARAARLTDRVLVVDTGSDLAGVSLGECSEEFRGHFASADLIVAKGQANYETLDEEDAPIWFALKVKCSVIARAIGGVSGQSVLRRQTARRDEAGGRTHSTPTD
jgi:uncharacterized protein with ATP-grasp and redox domains